MSHRIHYGRGRRLPGRRNRRLRRRRGDPPLSPGGPRTVEILLVGWRWNTHRDHRARPGSDGHQWRIHHLVGPGRAASGGTDLGACRADDAHQQARVSSIGTRTFPGGLWVSQPQPTWGCGPSRRSRQDAVAVTLGVGWPGRGWVAKAARAASSDIHWHNDACWLRLRAPLAGSEQYE